MLFKDISNFNKTSDYLSILNAVLIVEIIGIYLTLTGTIIHSKYLKYWYNHYGLSAVLADVIIIMIGLILARFFYSRFFTKFNIMYFVLVALIVQVIHDILFFFFFQSVKRGTNNVLDLFKDYGKELGPYAITGDSTMIAFSCIFASILAGLSLNSNIIYLLVLLYILPYIMGINK